MNTKIVLLLAFLLLMLQPLQGSSSLDGGEKQRQNSGSAPAHSPDLGEAGPWAAIGNPDSALVPSIPGSSAQSRVDTAQSKLFGSDEDERLANYRHRISPEQTRLQEKALKKPQRPAKAAPKYDPTKLSPIFGILSVSAGVMAVFALISTPLSWIFLLIFLLATPMAIIFGAIGMSRNRQSRGLAIAGFTLGLLCMVLMLLTLVLVIAALF